MNVNHGTLPYETVESHLKVSRNYEESVESVKKVWNSMGWFHETHGLIGYD